MVVTVRTGTHPAHRDEFVSCGLPIASFILAARRDLRRFTIPIPFESEPGKSLIEYGFLQLGIEPVCPVIDTNLHSANSATSGPCEAGDLVPSGSVQCLPTRRTSDHRFGFHYKGEVPGPAVRHQIGVARRLIFRHGWHWNQFQ